MKKCTYSFKAVAMLLLLCLIGQATLLGQATKTPAPAPTPAPKPVDYSYKPLTLKLNEDGSKYVRFINYMIWDKESNVLPYFVGSYLGAKKVMNIGAGSYSHPEAVGYPITDVSTADSITKSNQMVFGADFFLDMPTRPGKGDCINVLLTYYNMDFGLRYLRNVGILNERTTAPISATSWAGGGNAQPTIGTGSIVYGQVGYAFPKNKKRPSIYALYDRNEQEI